MSNMGTTIKSNLPADIEKKLAEAQGIISNIDGQIISKTKELKAKDAELVIVTARVLEAAADYEKKVADSDLITKSLTDRELKVAQKESALNVYANALDEKEKKVNKYLAIFENMKTIIK